LKACEILSRDGLFSYQARNAVFAVSHCRTNGTRDQVIFLFFLKRTHGEMMAMAQRDNALLQEITSQAKCALV